MTVEMVLNDLSLLSPVSERGFARKMMTDLIGVLSIARIYGVKTLRTRNNLHHLVLSSDYPIASWLNDNQVEREERSFFQRQLDIRTPLLADITDPIIHEEENLADFKYQGELAYALGIAYLLNGIAVSFHSEPMWHCDSLDLEITRLEDGTDSENLTAELTLTTSTDKIIHASKREHILGHREQIEYRLRAMPWHPQDELLPCYITANGKNLLAEWLDSLSEPTKEIIQVRLNQVKQGSLGDHKPVGEGVWELRIFYGPAYRIYFGRVEQDKLLLLYGGDKSTQVEDIIRAKKYWQDYK